MARFGAVSSSPNAVIGQWVHEKMRNQDRSMRLVIDVPDNRENRAFFVKLQAKLRKRFDQIEIYVASYSVDVL